MNGTSALISWVEGAYNGREQESRNGYTMLFNISNPAAPWRISNPFLGTGPEAGADQILPTFWVLKPIAVGETPEAKGPNVMAAIAVGTLKGTFTSQGEFSTAAGELTVGVRKSCLDVILPFNGPGSPGSPVGLPPEILVHCCFDEHTVVEACHEV